MASQATVRKVAGGWQAVAGGTTEDPTGGCQLPEVIFNLTDPNIPPTAFCMERDCDGTCNLTSATTYDGEGNPIEIVFTCTCGSAG